MRFPLAIGIAILLLMPFVHAGARMDKWVYHEEVFGIASTEMQVFFPYEDATPDKVVVQWGASKTIVPAYECKEWKTFYVCYTDTEEGDPLDHQMVRYKVHLEIDQFAPDVGMSRIITPLRIIQDEKARIETIITNTGDLIAKNVVFVDPFPFGLIQITDEITGCEATNNSARWTGSLGPGESKTCTYEVKGVKGTTFSSVAKTEYHDGLQTQYLEETQTIEVLNFSLDLYYSQDNITMELDDEQLVHTYLNNPTQDIPIEAEYRVTVPEHIHAGNARGWDERTSHTFYWKGLLNETKKHNFTFPFTAETVGQGVIEAELTYTSGNLRRSESRTIPVNVTMPHPKIEMEVISGSIAAGEEVTVRLTLENPSPRHLLRDVNIELRSGVEELGTESKSFVRLEPNETVVLIERTFIVPEDEGPILFSTLSFRNDKSQYFEIEGSESLFTPVAAAPADDGNDTLTGPLMENDPDSEEGSIPVGGDEPDDDDGSVEVISETVDDKAERWISRLPTWVWFAGSGVFIVIIIMLLLGGSKKAVDPLDHAHHIKDDNRPPLPPSTTLFQPERKDEKK
ncbi:MAG: hypothetical protein ABIC95_06605 [archaeon]